MRPLNESCGLHRWLQDADAVPLLAQTSFSDTITGPRRAVTKVMARMKKKEEKKSRLLPGGAYEPCMSAKQLLGKVARKVSGPSPVLT